jgi:hypothetical protein
VGTVCFVGRERERKENGKGLNHERGKGRGRESVEEKEEVEEVVHPAKILLVSLSGICYCY